jgi:hypothetical protein
LLETRFDLRNARVVTDLMLRANVGVFETPSELARSFTATRISSSSDKLRTFGSVAPPMNARSSADPAGARCAHFDDTHVHAVMRSRLWRRATTKPLPSRGCGMVTFGHASETLAVET